MGKILLALIFVVFLVISARTQERKSSDLVPAYTPAQEQTFSGVVQEVNEYQCPVSGTVGSHISVKGGSEIVEVHLAPTTFLRQYEIVVRPGDKVTVTGVRFVFAGKSAMLARVVVDGQSTFTFRNGNGRPEW
jgi:hypothetical protein